MNAARPTLPQAATVRRVTALNSRTKTFVLDVTLEAEPGQFAMLWLPGLDEKPFSLLSDAPLSFAVASVGPFSRAMHRLHEGDRVWVRGAYGRGFRLAGDDHLLVGGGYGVAPILFLARRALAAGGRVRSVIGARVADELLLTDDFRAAGAEVHLTTEDGSVGTQGLVTDVVTPVLAADPPDALYACGPHGMLAALRALSSEQGVRAQLSWEEYMRCGIGICGSCEHEGIVLCADGPVVEYGPGRGPDV